MSFTRRTVTRYQVSDSSDALGALGCLGFMILMFAAWATHVVWVIGKLAGSAGVTGGQIVLGVLGSFVPPVGVIHGVMIWFGMGMG